jgi:phosphoglycolate phosphatase-like HAD superfamily hydrolase
MKTYIVDIDGTISNLKHRLHFIDKDREGGTDWDAFYEACDKDEPIQPVIDVLLCLYHAGSELVFCTGRSYSVKGKTMGWLSQRGFLSAEIVMRANGDHRPDTIAKKELLESLIAEGKQIAGVFEDRPSVCRVWREMGLTVFQVGSGEEF